MNLADALFRFDLEFVPGAIDEKEDIRKSWQGLTQRHGWLTNPVSWFLTLKDEDRAGYLAGIDINDPDEIEQMVEFLRTVEPSSNGHKPKTGGMRLVDALVRAAEIEGEHDPGYYEIEHLSLPDDWETRLPWLRGPYAEFLGMGERDQLKILRYYHKSVSLTDDPTSDPYPEVLDLQAQTTLDTLLEGVKDQPGETRHTDGCPTCGQKPAGDKWVSPGRLVLTWPNLTGQEQRVLFIMAAHGDNNGGECYIGPTRIAEYLGYADPESDNARKNIKRIRKSLRAKGCITQTAKPRARKPATYRINQGPRPV